MIIKNVPPESHRRVFRLTALTELCADRTELKFKRVQFLVIVFQLTFLHWAVCHSRWRKSISSKDCRIHYHLFSISACICKHLLTSLVDGFVPVSHIKAFDSP